MHSSFNDFIFNNKKDCTHFLKSYPILNFIKKNPKAGLRENEVSQACFDML